MSNEALRLIEETGKNEFLDELVRRLIHRENKLFGDSGGSYDT